MDEGTELFVALLTILQVLIAIISLGGQFFYDPATAHDFAPSIEPMLVNVDQGSTTNITFDAHPGWLYHGNIDLTTDPKSVPSGIHINFEPELLKLGDKSVSQLAISVDKDAALGEHSIFVVSHSDDEREHKCMFKLNVSRSVPTPKHTLAEATTSTLNSEIEATTSTPNKSNMTYITDPVPITESPINMSYIKWNFNATESSFYTYTNKGYSFVTVTIHIKNNGQKPISSSPSHWKFICNETSYSHDMFSSYSHFLLSWDFFKADIFDMVMPPDIKAGENSTLILYYVVKGEPNTGSLLYDDPYNGSNTTYTTDPVPVTYTPINMSYIKWNFNATESSFYTYVPKGCRFVTLTIRINNYGQKPISSSPSHWKFICNETSYSYDMFSSYSHFLLSWDFFKADIFDTVMPPDIKAGENSTLILYYIVKGEPNTGSLLYDDPYHQI